MYVPWHLCTPVIVVAAKMDRGCRYLDPRGCVTRCNAKGFSNDSTNTMKNKVLKRKIPVDCKNKKQNRKMKKAKGKRQKAKGGNGTVDSS